MFSLTTLRLTLALLLATSAAGAATWTSIDPPGSSVTQVYGLNSSGELVGSVFENRQLHCFLLSGGVRVHDHRRTQQLRDPLHRH